MSNIFTPFAAPFIGTPKNDEPITVAGTIASMTKDTITLDNGETYDVALNPDEQAFRVGRRVTVVRPAHTSQGARIEPAD